jgi:UDP-glucose 4-epimerase
MKAIVTGGAGFIGSHIVDRLLSEDYEVKIIDNFITGNEENIKHNFKNGRFQLEKLDLLDFEKLLKSFKNYDIVFHIAANADIRHGLKDTRRDLEQNTIATYNVLEAMRQNDIDKIVFSSSSAVYGEPEIFPTPEDYPLIQTSFYGAAKLACEGLIEAFCEGFGFQCWVFRFVSLVGERHPHGVTFDFVNKLKSDPTKLEIIGDGKQKKSFLYIDDCVDGIMFALKNSNEKINIFNLGTDEYIVIKDLADIVVDEMGLKNVRYEYTGGKRGWVGDAPFVYLSIDKMKKLGWEPKTMIEDGIRKTVRWLLDTK